MEPLSLSIVEGAATKVSVAVKGERYIVGGVTGSDIEIVADLSGITSAGTYNEVKLTGMDKYGKGFEVVSINPPTMKIRVDRLLTKKFVINTDVEGLLTPEEYIRSETVTNPKEVTITGPEGDVNKIDRCAVSATFDQPLTKSTTVNSPIVLYDSEGHELSTELLVMDSETADITIPVLKQKEVPITIDFLNVPSTFPIEELEYTLEPSVIEIAGPESAIDAFDKLEVGYVDLNEVGKEGDVFIFDVSLPSEFRNLENLKKVIAEFDLSDMEEKYFNVTTIKPVKIPANFEVTVKTSQINGVKMIGPADIMQNLSASDLVAEIDFSSWELTPGPYSPPVSIYAPGKGLVWANGEYTAVVTIQEK